MHKRVLMYFLLEKNLPFLPINWYFNIAERKSCRKGDFSPQTHLKWGVSLRTGIYVRLAKTYTNLKFILYTLKRLCITIHFRCTFHPSSTLTMMFDGVCE